MEFQCRSCSKPGPVAAFATFEVAGKSFGDSLLHGLLVVEGIYCGRSWRSKYHFVSERREVRFRFEEIAAREEKVDTSPARVSGRSPTALPGVSGVLIEPGIRKLPIHWGFETPFRMV